jgi:hypothetical protein
MPDDLRSSTRIWLLPLSVLASAFLALFVLSHFADAAGSRGARGILDFLLRPDPAAAAGTLANAGEIVAAVLAIALTVVAIVVELASNRYTHRVTELFVNERINFVVMGLFVITALQGMWVTMSFDSTVQGGFVPYVGIGVTMGLLTLCLLILLPYFNFVFVFLNPIQIVKRIYQHTLEGIGRCDRAQLVMAAQTEAVRGIEQLGDVALNAMQHRDKGVSMAAVDALRDLLRDYQSLRASLPPEWYRLEGPIARNSDFVSMDRHVLDEVADRRIWLELKVLRQYQMVYNEALNRMRDVNYLVAMNTRLLAEEAARSDERELLHLLMKFFNTYLRAAINANDVRTAYNLFHQYRLLAQALLDYEGGRYAIEIARYFKYYGLVAFAARLPFILETVAYDLCTLNESAHARKSPVVDELLRVFLRVDRQSEGEVQEASLRGVRKAQAKLATYYLVSGDEKRARLVQADMAGEDPQRLVSIRDELFSVRSPEYWEIIDRGENFDYLSTERRAQLEVFFSWFKGLPTPHATLVSQLPEAPGSEHLRRDTDP